MSLQALPVQSSLPTLASTLDNTVQAVPLPFTTSLLHWQYFTIKFF